MTNDTLILRKFVPAWGQPDMSPFCAKVETYLRMAGIPYAVQVADSRKQPRQKLPVAQIGGDLVVDSSRIIEVLEARRSVRFDASLSPRERAVARAVKSMLEEHFYYVLLYLRWQDDYGWSAHRGSFEAHQAELGRPAPVRAFLAVASRLYIKGTLYRQGMGRCPRDEVIEIGKAHMAAVSELMSAGPFFFGELPSTLDATVYPFVGNLLGSAYDCPVKDFAASLPRLREYCERIGRRYFTSEHERGAPGSLYMNGPAAGHISSRLEEA